MDFVSGVLVYFLSKLLFQHPFSLSELAIGICFAFGPDLDLIPFFLLRRRMKLVSHWIIHFPLPYILIGGLVVWGITREWFFLLNFVFASLAHFIHDTVSVPGIQWFWPLSRQAYALGRGGVVKVGKEERDRFYAKLSDGAQQRSFLDEIKIRVGRWRPTWMRRG